ncbi:MAG: hypothetical protein R2705_05130 [Ilumatobacteraceae bacterium]
MTLRPGTDGPWAELCRPGHLQLRLSERGTLATADAVAATAALVRDGVDADTVAWLTTSNNPRFTRDHLERAGLGAVGVHHVHDLLDVVRIVADEVVAGRVPTTVVLDAPRWATAADELLADSLAFVLTSLSSGWLEHAAGEVGLSLRQRYRHPVADIAPLRWIFAGETDANVSNTPLHALRAAGLGSAADQIVVRFAHDDSVVARLAKPGDAVVVEPNAA